MWKNHEVLGLPAVQKREKGEETAWFDLDITFKTGCIWRFCFDIYICTKELLCWSILNMNSYFKGLNSSYIFKSNIFLLWYDAEFRSQLVSSTVKYILKALDGEQLQWTNGKENQPFVLFSENDLAHQYCAVNFF